MTRLATLFALAMALLGAPSALAQQVAGLERVTPAQRSAVNAAVQAQLPGPVREPSRAQGGRLSDGRLVVCDKVEYRSARGPNTEANYTAILDGTRVTGLQVTPNLRGLPRYCRQMLDMSVRAIRRGDYSHL